MLAQLRICIKGAGEMASGIAWRLHRAGMQRILMLEKDRPLAVRRQVSFCESVYDATQQVEGVTADLAENESDIDILWKKQRIAVMVDPDWRMLTQLSWDVVIDAILAKRNLGTAMGEAPLVIGLGPGFSAGKDVHLVVETNRGHHLGRVIEKGPAAGNTGIPGIIGGYDRERVMRAPCDGILRCRTRIGQMVQAGQCLGGVGGQRVDAQIDGVLRGLIRDRIPVTKGMKIGDIDPRGDLSYCDTISDKARAVAGGVLEAILTKYNTHAG